MMEDRTPESQLKLMLSKNDWNFMRRDWTRKTRCRNITETYSHIFLGLTKLIKVTNLVLRCYQDYPKIYKKFGPQTKDGGLEGFLVSAKNMKILIEDLLLQNIRISLPRTIPSEIVKHILDFSISGKKKMDAGFYSSKQLDKICEGIQRRKFLTIVNCLTITLFNAILFNKMELGGFTLEAQMDCFIKDVKAFYELSDDSNVTKDFTKFSKLDVPSAKRKRRGLHQYKHHLSRGNLSTSGTSLGFGRRLSRRPTSLTHDYAIFLLWHWVWLGWSKLCQLLR